MAIRTVYENVKSDFYAVERGGYTSVSDAIYDTVTDLLNHGFTLSSVKYTDMNGLLTQGSWPITETVYSKVSPGVGYQAGDVLEMVGGTFGASPFIFTVNTVDATTGGVLTYTVTNTGDYDNLPESPVETQYPVSNTTGVGSITVAGAVTEGNNISLLTSIPGPYTIIPDRPGTTPVVSGKHLLTSTSEMGDWTNSDYLPTRKPNVIYKTGTIDPTKIKIGQTIFGTGIPPDTVITAIRTFQLVNGVAYNAGTGQNVSGSSYYAYRDTTTSAVAIIVSNPVVLAAGDIVRTRGGGMTIDNTGTKIPSKWTVIVEAGGAVDPLNDDVGIYANVTTTTTNLAASSLYLEVGDIIGTKIYPGQIVVSTLEVGSLNGQVSVVAVEANVMTATANVTLSSEQTFSIVDEQLHFIFAELQPWRLALDIFDDQRVAVYAATPIQLTDTGNIAKVTNDKGQVIDTAGAMGSMPTGGPNVTSMKDGSGGLVNGQVYAITTDHVGPIPQNAGGPTGWYTDWPAYVDPNEISNVSNYIEGQSQEYFVANLEKIQAENPTNYSGQGTGIARHLDGSPWIGDPTQGFVNRKIRVGAHPQAYPLNYAITISDHGLFFGMWEGTWSTLQRTMNAKRDNYFNWLIIQRPVNRFTGQTLTAGRAPVFCVNCVGYKYWKFIVREADVLHPSQGDQQLLSSVYDPVLQAPVTQVTPYRVPADQHSEDSFAVINSSNQIALTEDSKYMVGFLHNLSTPRFRYSEELDMIGQTSADVCMSSNFISLTTYNESGPRQYRAMPSNNKYNSGLRICILTDTPN